MIKITALDPALPLINEQLRLSHRDAERVHVIQTNAGYYGDIGIIGHVNICVNDGNMQPFCVDAESDYFLIIRKKLTCKLQDRK